MASYFSVRALESQRSSGYKNTTHALAEIVDNAFDAGANTCRIIFIEKRNDSNRKYIDEILIADDGEGMTGDTLKFCLQFGGGTNTDLDEITSTKKIGKFGYGLPNASLSQCPNIIVASWQDSNGAYSNNLNLEELQKSQSIEIPENEVYEIPKYMDTVEAVINKNHGTIVSWKDCDRLSNSRAETIITKSESLMGKLFRYLIQDGKKIEMYQYEYSSTSKGYSLQGMTDIRKNDPLFLMEDTVIATELYNAVNNPNGSEPSKDPATYYKNYSISDTECKPTNTKLEDQSFPYKFEWKGQIYVFDILTSYANLDIQKPGIRAGGDTKVGGFYKTKEKECISFVRSKREISAGNYGFYNQADPRHRWWSIEVSFLPDADDLLGVHNNKQGIEFEATDDDSKEVFDKHTASLQQAREQLWIELTKRIDRARKEAWKILNAAAKGWDLKNSTIPDDPGNPDNTRLPGGTSQTNETTKNIEGTRPKLFTLAEKDALTDRLQEKYPDIEKNDIMKTIDLYDKSQLRGCVLYSSSESEKLWSLTNVGDFLIVLINTEHMFYQNMLHPLKIQGKESALTAIELFISSLAWEEHNHFGAGDKKNTIENYRSFVGIHLNQYLREFTYQDETLTEDIDEL